MYSAGRTARQSSVDLTQGNLDSSRPSGSRPKHPRRSSAQDRENLERQRASNGNRTWIEGGRSGGIRDTVRQVRNLAQDAAGTIGEMAEEEFKAVQEHERNRMRNPQEVDLKLGKLKVERNLNGGAKVELSTLRGKVSASAKVESPESDTRTDRYTVGKYTLETKLSR